MTASSLKCVQLVLVLEYGAICLKLLAFLSPSNESVFLEALNGEIDRLGQLLLTESSLGSHIKDEGHIFMIIHVADLLGCGYTYFERFADFEECADISNYAFLLDPLKLGIEDNLWLYHNYFG